MAVYLPSAHCSLFARRELERTSIAELIAVDEEKDNVLDVSRNMRNFRGGRKHRMQGPYNPLEMRMYSKLQSLQGYTLSVENDSVNSVLLDEFPSDSHERLLIAAQVNCGFTPAYSSD